MRPGVKLILALLLVFAVVLSMVPGESEAIPYRIRGYLKNSDGTPITLAQVSLTGEVYNISIPGYQTRTFFSTTDANGYFQFAVAAMEPDGFDQNSVLTVSYSTSDGSVSREFNVVGIGTWANLTFEEKSGILDVLLSPTGALFMVIIAAAALVSYYLWHSSDPSKLEETEGEETKKRVERRRKR